MKQLVNNLSKIKGSLTDYAIIICYKNIIHNEIKIILKQKVSYSFMKLKLWRMKCDIEPSRKSQNKVMRVIINMQRSSNADPLFSKNKNFKLEGLVKLEISKLMFNFDRC